MKEFNASLGKESRQKLILHGDKLQTQKGSNERLFSLTRTHSMHIFGEIPFVKPLNDTLHKRLEDCWHNCFFSHYLSVLTVYLFFK